MVRAKLIKGDTSRTLDVEGPPLPGEITFDKDKYFLELENFDARRPVYRCDVRQWDQQGQRIYFASITPFNLASWNSAVDEAEAQRITESDDTQHQTPLRTPQSSESSDRFDALRYISSFADSLRQTNPQQR